MLGKSRESDKEGIVMRGKKIREIKARVIAAGITIAFMTAVRPDPNPYLWGVALIALMMYEAISMSIIYIWRECKVQKVKRDIRFNEEVRKREGEILDEMLFNPIKIIS